MWPLGSPRDPREKPAGTPEKSQPAPHGALGEAASIAALVLILDGGALVHSQPLTLTPRWLTSWLGQPELHDGAPVPTLQMGTTENEGPGGSEPLPWLNVPPRRPSGAALPRRLGAIHSKGEVVQRPAAIAEWSPAPLSPYCRGAWLGPAGNAGQGLIAKAPCFHRDGAFCPALKAGASGQGKCPLGRWRAGSMGRRQPPSDGGEGDLRFGGSVCSIGHVQTKAKLHVWGPENWGRRWQKHPLPHNPFLQSLPPPSPAGPDLNLEGAPVP